MVGLQYPLRYCTIIFSTNLLVGHSYFRRPTKKWYWMNIIESYEYSVTFGWKQIRRFHFNIGPFWFVPPSFILTSIGSTLLVPTITMRGSLHYAQRIANVRSVTPYHT